MLIDTHAHIHSSDYPISAQEVLAAAESAGVNKIICVGTDVDDSHQAVAFVADKPQCWASIGIHPHEAASMSDSQIDQAVAQLADLAGDSKVVAIGECGLDFYYNEPHHLARQERLLRGQLALAQAKELPVIFHVRNAFAEFWPILADYPDVKGVIHSFSSGQSDINHILSKGLLVGLNGIMTFSRDAEQLAAARACPLDRLVLETDAPFLTPVPKRGTINQPANIALVAQFLSALRGESLDSLATSTSQNAQKLFGI